MFSTAMVSTLRLQAGLSLWNGGVKGLRDIEAESHDAVFIEIDLLAIAPDIGDMTHAFELDNDMLRPDACRQFEVLAISGDPGRQFMDVLGEGLFFIKSMG